MKKGHFYYIEKAERLGYLAESFYKWLIRAYIVSGLNLVCSLMFSIALEQSLEEILIVQTSVFWGWAAIHILLTAAIIIADKLQKKAERYAQKCER